jgi:hypothetical protein
MDVPEDLKWNRYELDGNFYVSVIRLTELSGESIEHIFNLLEIMKKILGSVNSDIDLSNIGKTNQYLFLLCYNYNQFKIDTPKTIKGFDSNYYLNKIGLDFVFQSALLMMTVELKRLNEYDLYNLRLIKDNCGYTLYSNIFDFPKNKDIIYESAIEYITEELGYPDFDFFSLFYILDFWIRRDFQKHINSHLYFLFQIIENPSPEHTKLIVEGNNYEELESFKHIKCENILQNCESKKYYCYEIHNLRYMFLHDIVEKIEETVYKYMKWTYIPLPDYPDGPFYVGYIDVKIVNEHSLCDKLYEYLNHMIEGCSYISYSLHPACKRFKNPVLYGIFYKPKKFPFLKFKKLRANLSDEILVDTRSPTLYNYVGLSFVIGDIRLISHPGNKSFKLNLDQYPNLAYFEFELVSRCDRAKEYIKGDIHPTMMLMSVVEEHIHNFYAREHGYIILFSFLKSVESAYFFYWEKMGYKELSEDEYLVDCSMFGLKHDPTRVKVKHNRGKNPKERIEIVTTCESFTRGDIEMRLFPLYKPFYTLDETMKYIKQ